MPICNRRGAASNYRSHEDLVEVAGEALAYSYYLSPRRRTLGITVHPDGSVMVRAPLRVPLDYIRQFVSERYAWIRGAQQTFRSATPRLGPGYVSGERHLFLGMSYCLEVGQGVADTVQAGNGIISVLLQSEPSGLLVKQALEKWYRAQAARLFPLRLAACLEKVATAGIPSPAGLTVRPMKSRLGSYSYRTSRVCLNLWLVKAPLPCIDYVIIHELCHAHARHHGPKFWELVARFEPEYAVLRRQLRELLA